MTNAETYAPLTAIPGFAHAFTLRQPGIDVSVDRDTAVGRLRTAYAGAVENLGFPSASLCTAEQVHGAEIAVVRQPGHTGGVDGLITGTPNLPLGILVADCCAVFAVDPVRRVVGLFHSGRKGSELGITGRGIRLMAAEFGTKPSDLTVLLSPCIRPPDYEIDFAALIRQDCSQEGVPPRQIHDSGVSTASDLARFYSYRLEKGKTGRMMALSGFRPS